jgi:LysM repeat protein
MTHRYFCLSLPIILLLAWGYVAFHAPSAFSAPPAQGPVTTPTSITLKPGDRTYTVQANDSYWSIAQKMYGNGNKYNLILQANNLTEKSKLRVGSVLIIPGVAETPVTVAPTGRAPPVAPVTPTPLPNLQATGQPTAVPTLAPTAQPTAVPTLPPVSVVARSQPPAAGTPADPAATRSGANLPSELRNQQLLTALDILSGIFAATSVICAFLAYQSYNRAKRFEKMVIVRRRARSHADVI